jgi:hypothetical protein
MSWWRRLRAGRQPSPARFAVDAWAALRFATS